MWCSVVGEATGSVLGVDVKLATNGGGRCGAYRACGIVVVDADLARYVRLPVGPSLAAGLPAPASRACLVHNDQNTNY